MAQGPTWVTDSAGVERGLSELARLVADAGGFLHPEMRVVCNGADLYVESGLSPADRSPLMAVPEPLLAPVDAFGLTVVHDKLRMEPPKGRLDPRTVEAMELLLTIYNATGKLGDFRSRYPLLALAPCPELLELLLFGRAWTPAIDALGDLFREGRWEELQRQAFLGTRTLEFQSEEREEEPGQQVLMPFIDFLNHHPRGASFRRGVSPEGQASLHVENAKPVPDSAETFACYQFLDPLDSYLVYGFVDESAIMARSVPLDLELGGELSIQVRGQIAPAYSGQVPPHLRELEFFIPQIHFSDQGGITVSHLYIPGPDAPFALSQILIALMASARPDLPQETLQSWALEGEARVVAENLRYYRQLGEMAERAMMGAGSPRALADVQHVVRAQLERIQDHADRRGLE